MSGAPERPKAPPLPTTDQVHVELRPLKQWVCWYFKFKGVDKNNKPKWSKVPVAPLTGENSGHDLAHEADWTDFDTAVTAAAGALKDKVNGVGFVFREGGGLTGIDFDDCLTPEGGVKDIEIKTWLLKLATYVEVSPSGQGLHAICQGIPARTVTEPLEIYDRLRFFTWTAKPWCGLFKPIAERQAVLDELVEWANAQIGKPALDTESSEITVEKAVAYLDRVCAELAKMTDGRQRRATEVCYRLGRIMGGKPADPRLEFEAIKKRITESLEKNNWPQEKFEVIERQLREGLNDPRPVKFITPVVIMKAEELKLPDMPASVLCGKLGEICRSRLADFPIAYSWLSVLAAASVLVKPHPMRRCNINVCLVGPVHYGKTQAQERANFLFRLAEQGLVEEVKSGSAEGLLEKIGDRGGSPALWFPDELSHVLEKAQIQNASFPSVLNSLFYKDSNALTVQRRKQVKFNARLSIAGGVVEENFGNSFGAATTAGLYDRFLFGLFPTGSFEYSYRPMEGPPLFNLAPAPRETLFDPQSMSGGPRVESPEIHSSVFDASDAIRKEEKIEPRLLELCLRTALICAAWDGKSELRASDLGPAWELARYQQRVRVVLQPNPGRNFDGIVAHKIINYLKLHTEGEKWLSWREVYRATKIMDFGSSVAERSMNSLAFAGQIERTIIRPPKGGPEKVLIRLARE
jgi:hypothetical protein